MVWVDLIHGVVLERPNGSAMEKKSKERSTRGSKASQKDVQMTVENIIVHGA